jgi:hypothetical protein
MNAAARTRFTTSGIWAYACCAICACICCSMPSSIIGWASKSTRSQSQGLYTSSEDSGGTLVVDVLAIVADREVGVDVAEILVDVGVGGPDGHALLCRHSVLLQAELGGQR